MKGLVRCACQLYLLGVLCLQHGWVGLWIIVVGCELSTNLAHRNTVGFLGICRGFVVEQVSIACCMAQCCACSLLRYLTACLCLPGLLLASFSV